MLRLLKLLDICESVNRFLARGLAWLLLFMTVLCFMVVVLRYVLEINWVWAQELVVYSHGLLFMLCVGYTLLQEGHVRVDIFYRDFSPRRKAAVDIMGVLLFLVPFCLLVLFYSIPYVITSWQNWEGSPQADGLPLVFLLKTAIIIMPLLLLLQGGALGIRSFLVLFGKEITTPVKWKKSMHS